MAGNRQRRASAFPGSSGEIHQCLCRAKSLRELFPRGCEVAAATVPEYHERSYLCSAAGPAPIETFDFFFDLFLDFFRDGFTVNDPGHDWLRDKIENLYRKKSACKELISSLHDTVVFKRQHLLPRVKNKNLFSISSDSI